MTVRLVVAVSDTKRAQFERIFDERTAGTWRVHVSLVGLYVERFEKETNDGWIEHYAGLPDTEAVLAVSDLTSIRVGQIAKVRRLTRAELIGAVNAWLRQNGFDWRENLESTRKLGPYRWSDTKQWIEQFHRVDPVRGRRLAASLLLQLRIIRLGEIAEWFTLPFPVDHNAYFIGSDPHSGDFGLITILSALLPGSELTDAQQIPPLGSTSTVCLFSDAGWSGGESDRRLSCMYRSCDKKRFSLGINNVVYMRFAFLTDVASRRISESASNIKVDGQAIPEPRASCPPNNRLQVNGEHGQDKGFAFQNASLKSYVDPADADAMRSICEKIGRQLSSHRPLGTKEIASTIGFEHSLPKAMLPLYIVEDGEVQAADGERFTWLALVRSKHLAKPAEDGRDKYCPDCPLQN